MAREAYRMVYIQPLNDDTADWYESVSKHHDSEHCVGEDAGLDLVCANRIVIPAKAISFKIPLGIKAVMIDPKSQCPVSYQIYVRSSTGSKTPLRLSNSVGIIDSGYRGELITFFDNVSAEDFVVSAGRCLVQICHGALEPFVWKTTGESLEEKYPSKRGADGFGSTGK